MDALDGTIVLDLLSCFVINCCNWLHNASAVVLEVRKRLLEAFGYSVDGLDCLDGEWSCAVSKDVQLLEFRDWAHHVLS